MSQPSPPISSLESLPKSKHTHHWADYVELLCLANADGLFSKGDLLDRWAERDDVGDRQFGETSEESDVEADPLQSDSNRENEPQISILSADDKRRQQVDDIYRHFEYRSDAFSDSYPFTLSHFGSLQRRLDFSPPQKLYIFLLLASSLPYIRPPSRDSFTRSFEKLTHTAIRGWLPQAEVHLFGTAVSAGDRYHGQFPEKLQRLADDLAEDVKLGPDDFHSPDHGDGGVDVVAWLPVGDQNSGLVIFLVQATCQADWKGKQHESGLARWNNNLTFTAPPNNILCIPFCFRLPDGTWFWRRDIEGSVLIDRVRLFWLLRDQVEELEALPYELVDVALTFREGLV